MLVDVYRFLKWFVSERVLTLVFSGVAAFFGVLTYIYVLRRDREVDARTAWVAIHNAMINLSGQWATVMSQRSLAGAHSSSGPNPYGERKGDYDAAVTQLRGRLSHLKNDKDPLIGGLLLFMDSSKEIDQWQREDFGRQFDAFTKRVGMKTSLK